MVNSSSNSLWLGLAFIVIGSLFLLSNLDVFHIGGNWWALFFLIPIASMGNSLWRSRQAHGRFTAGTRGQLIGVVTLVTIMTIFLFQLPWKEMWPVLLILIGGAMLVGSRFE